MRKTIFLPGLWESDEYLAHVIPAPYLQQLTIINYPHYHNRVSFNYNTDLAFMADLLRQHIQPDESFNIVAHSYGSQIALGLAEQGFKVNKIVHMTPMVGQWWVVRVLKTVVMMPFTGKLPVWLVDLVLFRKQASKPSQSHIPLELFKPPSFTAGFGQLCCALGMLGCGKRANPDIPTKVVCGAYDVYVSCACASGYPSECVSCEPVGHLEVMSDPKIWQTVFAWLYE